MIVTNKRQQAPITHHSGPAIFVELVMVAVGTEIHATGHSGEWPLLGTTDAAFCSILESFQLQK